jgi:hypothetical protein
LTAIHMDGNYSHLAPNLQICIPNMFKDTKHLRVLTMETPCSVEVASAITTYCNQLQRISITINQNADLICKEITQHSKQLLSFKILLLNGINLTHTMHSDSIEDFNFSREPSSPSLYSLPGMQFPHLKTLVYRVCYISEKDLFFISRSYTGLLLLDIRCCITGPRSGIQSGLQALWNCCKHMHTIQVPPRI